MSVYMCTCICSCVHVGGGEGGKVKMVEDRNLLAEVEERHGKKTANDGLSLSLTQQLLPLKLDLMTFIHLHVHHDQ